MKRSIQLIPDCKILVIGMGLIGAAYAKALSQKGYCVYGITRSQEVIDQALQNGEIRKGDTSVNEQLIKEADLIIFGLYPTTMIEWIEQNGHLIEPGTVVTDVSGVKGGVVEQIQSMLGEDVEFISAHPMAGKELTGGSRLDVYHAATPEMFYGANYLVVPTEKNTPEAILLCEQLGHILGFARVTRLSVDEHDRMIAYLSQLTHAIAVCLMCSADDEAGEDGENGGAISRLARLTGDSFRDLTRIAKINDGMWSELFYANRHMLLEQMDHFIDRMNVMRDALAGGDEMTMRSMMKTSTERRRRFDREKR